MIQTIFRISKLKHRLWYKAIAAIRRKNANIGLAFKTTSDIVPAKKNKKTTRNN